MNLNHSGRTRGLATGTAQRLANFGRSVRILGSVVLAGVLAACSAGGGGGGGESIPLGEDEGSIAVTPVNGLLSTGIQGGTFSPGSITYTLGNSGADAIDWTASADEPWILFSTPGGQIPSGASVEVTVSIDQVQAAAMSPGTNNAIVLFRETLSGAVDIRDVVLIISPPAPSASGLTLTPNTSFNSTGLQGGPFAPASMVYTLANTSGSPVVWSVGADQTWVTLSMAGGTLAASTTVDVTVSINQSVAASLPVGGFASVVTFSDIAAGAELLRAVNLSINPTSGSGSMASSVSQFGITWTFDKPYLVGRFANDDWWVQGPIQVLGISPQSTSVSGRTIHGSEINPRPSNGMVQGFDSSMYAQYASAGDYNPSRNVALGVSPGSPLSVPVNSSLVSTVSVIESAARPQLKTCAILTVLPSVPAAGSFRPAYVGSDKTLRFNESQLDYAKLASLPPVGSPPSLSSVERFFERPWLDHVAKFTGRYLHPAANMEDYGRDLTSQISLGAVMLQMNFSNLQKRTLLVRYVQLGIDLYGITQNGGKKNWEPAQGHSGGRKWPILFAGLMLNDSTMSSIGFDSSIDFGEDGQTFYVTETSPGIYNNGFGEYQASDVGLAEWGGFHAVKPSADRRGWFEDAYRLCCTANVWWGITISARIMGAKDAWNHDALFDYMDRFRSENQSRGITDFRNAWRDFDFAMYEAYRSSF